MKHTIKVDYITDRNNNTQVNPKDARELKDRILSLLNEYTGKTLITINSVKSLSELTSNERTAYDILMNESITDTEAVDALRTFKRVKCDGCSRTFKASLKYAFAISNQARDRFNSMSSILVEGL